MTWIKALQEWNKDKKWSIPKKGTVEYNEVMEIKNKMVDLGETKSKSKSKPQSKKKPSKLYGFVEMTLITTKQMKDFNELVNDKNNKSNLDVKESLKILSPFTSILEQEPVDNMIKGSGLSLYGSGMKGKFKKLTNKDRSNINSMVKQNNLSFGEVFQKNALDLVQNPLAALTKVYNVSKSLKNKVDDTIAKNVIKSLPRLVKKDMTNINRLLSSKSIGDVASKELANKVDTLVDVFKKKIPGLSENIVFGSGHCKKFSKKDIDNINKVAEACECSSNMTGEGLEDIFGKLLEDPIGNLKKLLNFQQANMPFKKLADKTRLGGKKPEKLFSLPWEQ